MPLLALVVMVVVAAAAPGCNCRSSAPKAAPPATNRTAQVPLARSNAGSGTAPTPPPPSRTLVDVTVDAVVAMVPTFAGAAQLGEARSTMGGRQVAIEWCIAAPDQAAAALAVRDGFAAAGWTDIIERGKLPRMGVAARNADVRLSLSLTSVPRPGCSPADKRWFASGLAYKVGAGANPLPPTPALDPGETPENMH